MPPPFSATPTVVDLVPGSVGSWHGAEVRRRADVGDRWGPITGRALLSTADASPLPRGWSAAWRGIPARGFPNEKEAIIGRDLDLNHLTLSLAPGILAIPPGPMSTVDALTSDWGDSRDRCRSLPLLPRSLPRLGKPRRLRQWLFRPPPYVAQADLKSETVSICNPSKWRVKLEGFKLGDRKGRHVFEFPSDCIVAPRKSVTRESGAARRLRGGRGSGRRPPPPRKHSCETRIGAGPRAQTDEKSAVFIIRDEVIVDMPVSSRALATSEH